MEFWEKLDKMLASHEIIIDRPRVLLIPSTLRLFIRLITDTSKVPLVEMEMKLIFVEAPEVAMDYQH